MAMFDAFKGSVGTGTQVMVVGVGTNDIDGKMTMQVYNTTNGAGVGFGLDSTGNKGYAIGSQVGGMVDEINRLSKEEGSWVYKNTKTNQGIFQAAGATDSSGYLKDWKDEWAALARLAGGKKTANKKKGFNMKKYKFKTTTKRRHIMDPKKIKTKDG